MVMVAAGVHAKVDVPNVGSASGSLDVDNHGKGHASAQVQGPNGECAKVEGSTDMNKFMNSSKVLSILRTTRFYFVINHFRYSVRL